VSETERVIAPFYSRWSREQYTRFVEKFRLEPQRKVGELSHGQRTLLSLAVAFSHDAELIIMDEPTSGLDPIVRSELIDLLYEIIQDEHRAILFSTHITTDLEKIADHITFVDDGKILFSDSKDEILERYRIVRGPNAVLTDEARELCIGVRETPVGFEALSGASDELNALTGGRCIAERASLDDIMVSMVGRQIHVH
jgi:ABC-2 type transport system ATP-binding protein